MSTNKITIKQTMMWYLAIAIEWVIVPLYIASMGYDINLSVYQSLKNWQHVTILYYMLACVDIMLFSYFVLLYRIKKNQMNLMLVSVFCCLTQIILLISKVII